MKHEGKKVAYDGGGDKYVCATCGSDIVFGQCVQDFIEKRLEKESRQGGCKIERCLCKV